MTKDNLVDKHHQNLVQMKRLGFTHGCQLEAASYWNGRTLHLDTFEEFLSNKIPPREFIYRFETVQPIDRDLRKHNKRGILENLDSKDLMKLQKYTYLIEYVEDLSGPFIHLDKPLISEKKL